MRNLHAILGPKTDLDYALIWYFQEYLEQEVRILRSGLFEVNEPYYTQNPWQPIVLSDKDEEYYLQTWYARGAPKIEIK